MDSMHKNKNIPTIKNNFPTLNFQQLTLTVFLTYFHLYCKVSLETTQVFSYSLRTFIYLRYCYVKYYVVVL